MALDRYERTSLLQKTEPITDAGARQALASSQSLQARLDSISAFALGQRKKGSCMALKLHQH